MSLELFEKICREYVQMGGGYLGFSPLMSEPLVDPLLLTRVRYIRERCPEIKLYIYTNGIGFSSYSDADLRFLLESFDVLNISLSILDREDYRSLFGVDKAEEIGETLARIRRLTSREERSRKLFLHVRTAKKRETLESRAYRDLVDSGFNCRDVTNTFSDWGGIVRQEDLPPGSELFVPEQPPWSGPCIVPIVSQTVLPNGEVLACGCFDARGRHVMGNAETQTLEQIWTGESYRLFRLSFQENSCPRICRSCIMYCPCDSLISLPCFVRFDPARDNFWLTFMRYGDRIQKR